MAWLERRGKKYLVRWRESDVVHSEARDNRADARILKADVEKRQLRGTWVDAESRKQPLGEYIRVSIESDLSVRLVTRQAYLRALRNHVAPRLGSVLLGDVTAHRVRAALADIHATRGAWSTVISHRVLTRAFRQALEEGAIVKNPMVGVKAPKPRRREIRILSPQEVQELSTAIAGPYHALVLLAAWGGLRIGELGALRREDIDFENNTVSVRQALSTPVGGVEVGPPKTPSSRRTISIPGWVMKELAEHLLRYPSEPTVFMSPWGKYLTHYNLQPHWERAKKITKIECRFHDLRHSAVAILISQGAHPKLIQSRMGHSSIMMTLDTYGSLFPSADAELAASLERFAPGGDSTITYMEDRR